MELRFERERERDVIVTTLHDADADLEEFPTTRTDDFSREVAHLFRVIEDGTPSPLDLAHGVATMHVIAAAFTASVSGRRHQVPTSTGGGV